jgi:5-hydroxyisourate hydrolase-like protein (transthyretin family)
VRRVAGLAAICLLLLLPLGAARAQGPGAIEGQVANGTSGASPDSVTGLEVTLYALGAEGEEYAAEVITDHEGRFRFENLDAGAEQGYRFELSYEGVTYSGEVAFSAGDTVLPILVTVYETTDSDEAIVVTRQHIILDFSDQGLAVQELYIFDNSSDMIYVGRGGSILHFSLPGDATGLALSDSHLQSNVIETDQGFDSLLPVEPGQSQVLFSYLLPYDQRSLTLRRKLMYPTNSLDVLIPDVGVQAESGQLTYRGLTGGEQTSYLHFEAQDLGRGAEIEVSLSGSPGGAATLALSGVSLSSGVRELWPWIAAGLVLVGGLLAFAQLRLQRTRRKGAGAPPPVTAEDQSRDSELRARRQELLQLVADLDDAFAEGNVSEEGYRQLRESVHSRLMEISRRLEADQQG